MMSYKDRAWCSQYNAGFCANHLCSRAFTGVDREYAINWWGNSNFPLALSDLKTEICGYTQGTKND